MLKKEYQKNKDYFGIIYLITCKITGGQYVGKTTQYLKRRWLQHCRPYDCKRVYNAINKYGKDQFWVDQIDNAKDIKELNMKEAYWIEKLGTLNPNGYNLRAGGLGGIMTKETKKKISIAHKGKKLSQEIKDKIGKSSKGKTREERYGKEVADLMTENLKRINTNRVCSEETRKKRSISRKGKGLGKSHIVSEETKRKISIANKGKTWNLSEETKKKMSATRMGKSMPEETKKKLSISKTGTKLSEETKRKIGIASLNYRQKLQQNYIDIRICLKNILYLRYC